MEVSFKREEYGTPAPAPAPAPAPQQASKCTLDPLQTDTSFAAASPETIRQRQGTFLCSVKSGNDCNLSIYDEANLNETRFKKDGNHRKILLDLSALLKKAAECIEEGKDSTSAERPKNVENVLTAGASYIYTFLSSLDDGVSNMEFTDLRNTCTTLLLTTTGDVYGKGRNTLIRCEKEKSPLPMKEGASNFLKEYVKVDNLCGLGIKKIRVGSSCGVALTRDNKLYYWGRQRNVPNQAILMVEEYRVGSCHCGNKSGGRCSLVGGVALMFCAHGTLNYKTYTVNCPPPPGIQVKKFIRYDYATITCPQCSELCTSSHTLYGGFKINYCSACNLSVQNDEKLRVYVRLPLEVDHQIIDADVWMSSIYTLSEDNTLKKTDHQKMNSETINTPKDVVITKISCGCRLLAAISDTGELYCVEDLPSEEDVDSQTKSCQPINLQKVDVPAPVLNVQCGGRSIFCFLVDGTKIVLHEGTVSKIPDIYVFPTALVEPLLGIYSNMLATAKTKMNAKDDVSALTSMFNDIHLGDLPTENAPAKPKNDSASGDLPRKQGAIEPSCKPNSKTEASNDGDETAASLTRLLEKHTLENTVPQDAVYAFVYETYSKGNFFLPPHKDRGLSVLIVTSSGEVFGKGGNSLFIRHNGPVEIPMKAGGGEILKRFEKVDMLSSIGIKKVFVGVGTTFGMALSTEGKLYKWGIFDEVPAEAIISVDQSGPSRGFPKRSKPTRGGKDKKTLGTETRSGKHSPCIKRFIRYDIAGARCECATWGERSTRMYNGYYVNYCPSCECNMQVDKVLYAIVKLPVQVGSRIADMDGGQLMYCILFKNNKIEVSTLDDPTNPKPVTIPVVIPRGVVIDSVSCDHLLIARTGTGDLYWCGKNEEPFMFAVRNRLSLKLNKVDVPGRVLHYCTAGTSLVCLLADGSIVRMYAGIHLPPVPVYPLFNFVFHTRTSFHTEDEEDIEAKISELNHFLVRSRLKSLPSILGKLYGKQSYSDVTLKLADGPFPAHRAILLCKSRYFKNALEKQDNTTLDLTYYNPRAVKCLLQYLYEVSPDKLSIDYLDDILDLREMALSWDEPTVACLVAEHLKAEMSDLVLGSN